MDSIQEQLQIFARRFDSLNASCCDQCCGQQVSMTQSHILFELRRAGNPSMQQVAEELRMDVTTFSRQAKALEQKGLISRSVSPEDRRVVLLSLTDEGLRVLGQIDQFLAARIERIFSSMTPFEQETVIRSLALLNEAVTKASCSQHPNTIACCN